MRHNIKTFHEDIHFDQKLEFQKKAIAKMFITS